MCGINGFIQFEQDRSKEKMHSLVHNMNEKIIHRGPDHEGIYSDSVCALGMRRLSVIDLENGNQPIWNEKHTKLIVFNGEIYNYKLIKENLQSRGRRFHTDSDTEVVLVAYEEYGLNCFDYFDGMFAFAIYDIEKQEWILARDRVGEKPLYYRAENSFFLFGSELKSLTATNLFVKDINIEALSTYFQLTYIPAPQTIYEGVNKLIPGTVLIINRFGKIESSTYWNLKPWKDISAYDDYEKCKSELRENLFDSVQKRMVADVPLGAFLSGGFDSSIVVGIMSQLSDKKINTFNIGFKERQYDESSLAKIVAKKNNTKHNELILDWDEVINDIDLVLDNIDEPFSDSSLIATYAVSKLAKRYVTVVLTGDAGDELFAGYNKYLGTYYGEKYNKIPNILRKSVIEPIAGILPKQTSLFRKINKVIKTSQMNNADRATWLMSLGLKKDELARLVPDGDIDALKFIEYQFAEAKDCDVQTQIQYADFKTVLEGDMLAKVDRASMLASLETRVPMLNKAVIELAFNIPTKYKIDGKRRKIILKDTFRDLLPDELFTAPKHGFGVPIGKWLSYELLPQLKKYANGDLIREQGLFDNNYINYLIDSHMNRKRNASSELWTFFVFQNWFEREFAL